MAIESMAMMQQLPFVERDIKIYDRNYLRVDQPQIAPVGGEAQEPKVAAFSTYFEPAKAQQIPSNLPQPMQEATKMGGVLRIQDARQISAVLERFQQSQESRWSQMVNRVKSNPNVQLSPTLNRQLEMKMGSVDRQLGRIGRDLNLPPSSSDSNADPFAQSLGVTTDELSKPLKTFFSFLARGENQLYKLEKDLQTVYANGTEGVNPAVLLKMQLKMTHISQQLELFTSILNKGLESSKTVFNTQI